MSSTGAMEQPMVEMQAGEPNLNELYWNSPETLEELASRLSMSRSTLYAAVRPLGTGRLCGTCGGDLVFANRTARATGRATCSGCEDEVAVDAAAPSAGEGPRDSARVFPGPWARSGEREPLQGFREELAAVPISRVATIGGAAMLGVVVGASTVHLLRRLR